MFLDDFFARAREIIGDRTQEEKKYDDKVLEVLREGKSIDEALNQASEAYPSEALDISDASLEDLSAHYDYLLHYEEIRQMLASSVWKRRFQRFLQDDV